MKNILPLFLFLMLFSCDTYIDKPKNLLSETKMAEVMADMALNDQTNTINPMGNLEVGTRFILKNNNVKPQDFVDSYQYYVVKQTLPEIIDKAQDIIKNKHPEAEKYINKKLEENKQAEPLVK